MSSLFHRGSYQHLIFLRRVTAESLNRKFSLTSDTTAVELPQKYTSTFLLTDLYLLLVSCVLSALLNKKIPWNECIFFCFCFFVKRRKGVLCSLSFGGNNVTWTLDRLEYRETQTSSAERKRAEVRCVRKGKRAASADCRYLDYQKQWFLKGLVLWLFFSTVFRSLTKRKPYRHFGCKMSMLGFIRLI